MRVKYAHPTCLLLLHDRNRVVDVRLHAVTIADLLTARGQHLLTGQLAVGVVLGIPLDVLLRGEHPLQRGLVLEPRAELVDVVDSGFVESEAIAEGNDAALTPLLRLRVHEAHRELTSRDALRLAVDLDGLRRDDLPRGIGLFARPLVVELTLDLDAPHRVGIGGERAAGSERVVRAIEYV